MIPAKIFVLDTSAIIGQPDSITTFTSPDENCIPNMVVIPKIVLEELDKKKSDERIGPNVRKAHNILDALTDAHQINRNYNPNQDLESLIRFPETGGIIAFSDAIMLITPYTQTPDTYILGVAKKLHERFGNILELVTLDINLKIRAFDEGVPCKRLRRRFVKDVTEDSHYKGYVNLLVPPEIYIQAGKEGHISLDTLRGHTAYNADAAKNVFKERGVHAVPIPERFYNNMGITLINPEMPKYALLFTTNIAQNTAQILTYSVDRHKIQGTDLWFHKPKGYWGIQPHQNDFAQMHALNLMFDPEIKGVALTGGPGTGKTTLIVTVALSYYLDRVSTTMSTAIRDACQHRESKYYVSKKGKRRSVVNIEAEDIGSPCWADLSFVGGLKFLRPEYVSSKEVGFLPGDLESKTLPFLKPIYEAITALGREITRDPLSAVLDTIKQKRDDVKDVKDIIEVINTAVLRGRNFRDCFILCTEYQNGDPDFAELFIGRMHEDSKAFMEGDIGQIDNRYVALEDNAMTLTAYALRETDAPFGFILLDHNYREGLSKYSQYIRDYKTQRARDGS